EATITLEDVEVLTGLPTGGLPVTVGLDRRSADVICQKLLGATSPARSFMGHSVKISWVKGEFDHLPTGAPPDVVTRYTRAYTWVLLGAVLLADRSGDLIPVHLLRLVGDPNVARTFSWGSAVLAWLYKAMGRATFFTGGSQKGTGDLGGFTLLVQLWALERFSHIADRYIAGGDPPVDDSVPRGVRWIPIISHHQHRVVMRLEDIRYALDRCMKFVWMPYACREQDYHLDVDELWRAVTPHDVHRLYRVALSRPLHPAIPVRAASPTGCRACRSRGGVTGYRFQSAGPGLGCQVPRVPPSLGPAESACYHWRGQARCIELPLS
ncbi:Protein MAIN-LIKE 2, partial [Linum perenne]